MKSSDKINIIIAFVAIASLALGIYNHWYIQNLPSPDELVMEGNTYLDNGDYKRAVRCYTYALKIDESDTNAWKNKGFALFNLGIDNESVSIHRHNIPPYSCGQKLIDYYNLTYQPTRISRYYLERSLQCFKKAVYHDPKDPEAWLYKGIVSLYLSPSSICNPVEDFDETLTLIDNLPYEKKSYPPLRDIESSALYGKDMAYSKLGQRETFMTQGDTVKKTIKKTG